MTNVVGKRRRTGAVGVWALVGVAAGAFAGCATTEMTATWTDPAARGTTLPRVAVVFVNQDEAVRRMAEDEVAKQIKGSTIVPSYKALGNTDLRDQAAVKEKLLASGFDGVLVMRMAGVSETIVPSAMFPVLQTYDACYLGAINNVYGPGYLRTETTVHVVSKLSALSENKLIWAGSSQTFDPSSSKQLIATVARAVAKALQKEHLIS